MGLCSVGCIGLGLSANPAACMVHVGTRGDGARPGVHTRVQEQEGRAGAEQRQRLG